MLVTAPSIIFRMCRFELSVVDLVRVYSYQRRETRGGALKWMLAPGEPGSQSVSPSTK